MNYRSISTTPITEKPPVIDKLNPKIIILSGKVDSGKTSTLTRWVDTWQTLGLQIGGVLTAAVMDRDKKIGYDLIDINSGNEYPLVRSKPFDQSWQMGRFFFDKTGFNLLHDKISRQCAKDLYILDEIGPLEMIKKQGLYAIFIHLLQQHSSSLLLVVRESTVQAVCAFIEHHDNSTMLI